MLLLAFPTKLAITGTIPVTVKYLYVELFVIESYMVKCIFQLC